MIDLTNKPEGATHYIKDVFYRLHNGVWLFYVSNAGWLYGHESKDWHGSNCIEIPPLSWSIYSNTKPLSELSDEQRGLLFNHGCNGGAIQVRVCAEWLDSSSVWQVSNVYRAKQKTERELFIDAVNSALSNTALMTSLYAEMLFDSGKFELKAPKVGE